MLKCALSSFADHLNRHVALSHQLDEDVVVLKSPTSASGPVPEAQNKIVVLVSNISEDTMTMDTRIKSERVTNLSQAQYSPLPICLTVEVVVAANYDSTEYLRGLHYLSSAIEYCHAFPVFDVNNSPEMGCTGIEKFTVDMKSIGTDSTSQLWSMLGGRYLPSVVYRLRLMPVGVQISSLKGSIDVSVKEEKGRQGR